MILLDTDHLSVLLSSTHSQYAPLVARLQASADQQFVASVISLEEQLRGWLAEIRRQTQIPRQVMPYQRLAELVRFFGHWRLLHFDNAAAQMFMDLRAAKIRVGSQDLKIASVALTHQVLLLSANLRDFEQVPGLRVENWLQPPLDEPRKPK